MRRHLVRRCPKLGVRRSPVGAAIQESTYPCTSRTADTSLKVYVIRKVAKRPDELRELAMGRALFRLNEAYALSGRAGLERTRNIYAAGGRRTDYVIALALRARI